MTKYKIDLYTESEHKYSLVGSLTDVYHKARKYTKGEHLPFYCDIEEIVLTLQKVWYKVKMEIIE